MEVVDLDILANIVTNVEDELTTVVKRIGDLKSIVSNMVMLWQELAVI